MRFPWPGIAAAAVVSAILYSSSAAAGTRVDPPSPYYVAGFLTASGSDLAIAWDAAAESDDPGGPVREDPARLGSTVTKGYVDPAVGLYTGANVFLPEPDVFRSAPVRHDVYLDPSRLIRLDLYLWMDGRECQTMVNTGGPGAANNGYKAPTLEVELRMGDTLLTGGLSSVSADVLPAPLPPPGHCYFPFGMHPEETLVPEGAVLTLTVTHLSQNGEFRYGLGGSHRSVLRLPYFPLEELVFRNETLAAQAQAKFDQGGTGLLGAWPFATTLAVAAAQRRGARQVLLVAALVVLSGCSSESAPSADVDSDREREGSIQATVIPNPQGASDKGMGSVSGRVLDEYGLPIGRVRASLLTSTHFADTDVWGRFRFLDVPAGTHVLRVGEVLGDDRTETVWKTFTASILVTENSVTRLEVTLRPVVERPPDYRPHRHDLWGSTTTATLFSNDVNFGGASALCLPEPYCPRPAPTIALPASDAQGNPIIVRTGTEDVEVALSWDTSSTLERLGVYFHPANDPLLSNRTYLLPRGSGVPFHIRTTWESTDRGHERATKWSFGVFVPPDQHNVLREQGTNAYPTVHATIIAHKGFLPVEPAHPDLWNGTDVYTIHSVRQEIYQFQSCSTASCRYVYLGVSTPLQNLVLLETRWIEAGIDQDEPAQEGQDAPWSLFYRAAPEAGTCDNHPVGRGELDSSRTHHRWRFAINATDPDPPYAAQSLWCLVFKVPDAGYPGFPANGKANLTLIAHKDRMPEAAE